MSKKVTYEDAAFATFMVFCVFASVSGVAGLVLHGIFGGLTGLTQGQFLFVGAILGFLAVSGYMQTILKDD